jgi:hypothetical protein
VSRSTTGVDAKMPENTGLAVNPNRHRTPKRATLRASIDDSAAERVPSRSLLGSGHVPWAARSPQPQRRLATNAEPAAARALHARNKATATATLAAVRHVLTLSAAVVAFTNRVDLLARDVAANDVEH